VEKAKQYKLETIEKNVESAELKAKQYRIASRREAAKKRRPRHLR
jgi:hypothetical protein